MKRDRHYTGSEKSILRVGLDRHRDAVLWKLEGLDDAALRRVMVPSGTSLLGLVKHLGFVEYDWFCSTFGRPVHQPPQPIDENDPDSDLRISASESTQDILSYYAEARAAADEVLTELDLDAIGTSWFGEPVSLRWVTVHMLEETARHAGHVDILRELIDGSIGDHPEFAKPGDMKTGR